MSLNKVVDFFEKNFEIEDTEEKAANSIRIETPKHIISKYLPDKGIILDAGCGCGINAKLAANKGLKIVLLDISKKMLNKAKENLDYLNNKKRLEFAEGDIINLSDFEENTFDFTMCIGDAVSYCLDKRKKAISELSRVTKKDKLIVLGVDFFPGRFQWLKERNRIEDINMAEKEGNTNDPFTKLKIHLFNRQELIDIANEVNLDIIEMIPVPSDDSVKDLSSEDYMVRLDLALKKKLPDTECPHIIMVARKK